MTIFNSIEQAKSLLSQLSNTTQHKNLVDSISKELETITVFAQQLTKKSSPDPTISKPEMKSGCYIFANAKGFFCPNCYDNTGNKVATRRLNSKLRVCPICRASIN
ncbi:MAG: hypothetical protein COA95_05865 [Methylophaga sp.]|nr:MAG: hypothetical protein COA95_05865 [Methylophaga sp.]